MEDETPSALVDRRIVKVPDEEELKAFNEPESADAVVKVKKQPATKTHKRNFARSVVE